MITVNELAEKGAQLLKGVKQYLREPLIMEPFYSDFQYSFCWSSNAIEGNTLTLDDTISFLEYDEVRSGHTFSEYEEAKRLNKAIHTFLSFDGRRLDEEFVQAVNAVILDTKQGYRQKNVFIGNRIEAVYYPPDYSSIPALMGRFFEDMNVRAGSFDKAIQKAALKHLEFERIHPFVDGNGRTGRLLLNQHLVNNGLLPIIIEPKSKYRQAFRLYDKNEDASMMEYILYKAELNAIERVRELAARFEISLGGD